ncbi:Uma2 family endonuclease, partial [Streptomyces sp. TRM76130]|nr:Uma2 family endonuclease [Streptomyces sp. TRM76130]
MSALTVSQDPEQSWDDLVRFWEEMEWPEGSKVEIIAGIITVSPAPALRHNIIAERIQRRLYSVIPDAWGIYQTLALAVPSRLGMLIPDLVVARLPEDGESDSHIPAAFAELVVEVTSRSNARHDRVT